MKLIKFLLVAVITVCTFMTASAQVSVRARIGTEHRVHHRTVVVRRPIHHRTVVVRRPVRRYHRRHVVVRHY